MPHGLAGLLVNRSFALLWLAQALSSFGEYFMAATTTVWIVTDLAAGDPRTPIYVGLVVMATAAPRLFLAPFAGAWVDRLPARRTMLLADLGRLVVYVPFLVIVLTGPALLSVWAVIALQLILSSGAQLFTPARNALVQVVVPQEQRVAASSRSVFANMGVGVLATMAGPVAFAAFGVIPAIVIDAMSFLLSALLILLVRDDLRPHTAARGSYWGDLAAGIRAAWRIPSVRDLILGMGAYGVCLGVNNAALPLFALDTIGLSAPEYGIVSGMFSVGGLVGAVIAPRLLRGRRLEPLLAGTLVALGAVYVAYSFSRSFVPALLIMGAAGVVFSVYVMCQGPILQERVPVGSMGRISSLTTPVMSATSLVATGIASVVFARFAPGVAQRQAYAVAIATAAVVMAASGALLVIGARRQVREARG